MRHHLKFVAVSCAAVGGVIGMAAEGEGTSMTRMRVCLVLLAAPRRARLSKKIDVLAAHNINPVKHGLVSRVRDWPHSSFHRDVRGGIFPEDWAGDVQASGQFGER
jgi:hypothetical protein